VIEVIVDIEQKRKRGIVEFYAKSTMCVLDVCCEICLGDASDGVVE
jgi:hypothetical protein